MVSQTIVYELETELARLKTNEESSVRAILSRYFRALLNLVHTNPEFQVRLNLAEVCEAITRTARGLLEKDEERKADAIEHVASRIKLVAANNCYGVKVETLLQDHLSEVADKLTAECQKVLQNNHRHFSTIFKNFEQLTARLQDNTDQSITLELVKSLLVLWISKLDTKLQNMYQFSVSILNGKVCVDHTHPVITDMFVDLAKQYGILRSEMQLESITQGIRMDDRKLIYFFRALEEKGEFPVRVDTVAPINEIKVVRVVDETASPTTTPRLFRPTPLRALDVAGLTPSSITSTNCGISPLHLNIN